MRCPFCDADKEDLKVIDSRTCEDGRAVRRRRQCLLCRKRFTTYERVETIVRLSIIKKDGSRVPWDRNKILTGLERACYKRPIHASDLQRIVDEVEEEIFHSHDKEVRSAVIGELVSERLRKLDQVAYVRFASVYRHFSTLEELMDEARHVLDSQRRDAPGQGSLFVERATAPKDAAGNARPKRKRRPKPAEPVEPQAPSLPGVATEPA